MGPEFESTPEPLAVRRPEQADRRTGGTVDRLTRRPEAVEQRGGRILIPRLARVALHDLGGRATGEGFPCRIDVDEPAGRAEQEDRLTGEVQQGIRASRTRGTERGHRGPARSMGSAVASRSDLGRASPLESLTSRRDRVSMIRIGRQG